MVILGKIQKSKVKIQKAGAFFLNFAF